MEVLHTKTNGYLAPVTVVVRSIAAWVHPAAWRWSRALLIGQFYVRFPSRFGVCRVGGVRWALRWRFPEVDIEMLMPQAAADMAQVRQCVRVPTVMNAWAGGRKEFGTSRRWWCGSRGEIRGSVRGDGRSRGEIRGSDRSGERLLGAIRRSDGAAGVIRVVYKLGEIRSKKYG